MLKKLMTAAAAIITLLGLIYQVIQQAEAIHDLFKKTEALERKVVNLNKELVDVSSREDALRGFIAEEQKARPPRADGWRFDHRTLRWRPLLREEEAPPIPEPKGKVTP